MKVLHDKDLVEPLQALARAGKPIFSISAGSIMLEREWVRFPDVDSKSAELFPCLSIAPLHVDAHAEADDWEDLRVLVDLLRRRGDAEPVGYGGLTASGGLRVEVGEDGVKVEAVGTPIPRIGVRDSKLVDLPPLVP
jgi:hypothetical protein